LAKARKPSTWYVQIRTPLQVREAPDEIRCCRTPADASRLLPNYGNLDRELFCTVLLNGKNNVINVVETTHGLADASLVHPREVFREAIRQNALAVVLLHNHPSGDPTPSAEDIRITRQLIEAGRIIDIKVMDHIIVGRPNVRTPGFCSLREEGVVSFV